MRCGRRLWNQASGGWRRRHCCWLLTRRGQWWTWGTHRRWWRRLRHKSFLCCGAPMLLGPRARRLVAARVRRPLASALAGSEADAAGVSVVVASAAVDDDGLERVDLFLLKALQRMAKRRRRSGGETEGSSRARPRRGAVQQQLRFAGVSEMIVVGISVAAANRQTARRNFFWRC